MVEQRWSQRRLLSLGVKVYDHGLLLTECKSRDVGLGGIFLESASNYFSPDHEVELFFTVDDKPEVKHKLKAKVVRILKDGVGLVFKDFDTNSFRALQEIMRYSTPMATA